jgi:hypothetical protein
MTNKCMSLAFALLTACSGYESQREFSDESTGRASQEFRANVLGVHYPGTDHADITEDALPFLFEDLREDLGAFNEETDSGETQYDSAYHVDNCRIEESFKSIRERYVGVVNAIKDGLWFGAVLHFGTILHTTQDFYSHSNWVDLGQSGLVTYGYPFEFPSATPGSPFGPSSAGVVTLEEPLPPDWSVSVAWNSRIPVVVTPAGTKTGLITGTYSDNTDGPSVCPPNASIPHGPFFTEDLSNGEYLSKDDPDSIRHDLAKRAAIRQTTEEFCRWARLVLLRHGRDHYEDMLGGFVEDRGRYEAMCPNARGLVTALTTIIW